MINKPFRITLTDEEISRAPKTDKDFFEDWMDLTTKSEENWNRLTEEEKRAWQEENCITEKCFCREEGGEPYMIWYLNTDWTWNIWDLERGIEFFRCYPVSTNLAKEKDLETEEIIEEISIDY